MMQDDSLVVIDEQGNDYLKGDAVIYLLQQLGGLWRAVSYIYSVLPRTLRNKAYDFVGQRRLQWFGETMQSCPILPATY